MYFITNSLLSYIYNCNILDSENKYNKSTKVINLCNEENNGFLMEDIPQEEILELLKAMVNVDSINPPGKEMPMVDLVYKYMVDAGLEVEKVYVAPERYDVIAKLKGKNPEGIIFTGHMDVVPVSDDEIGRWRTDPFSATVIDDYLYGRGSSDMKSGLCAAMVAMKYLKEKNIVPSRDIYLVATIDEEDFMQGSKALAGSHLIEGARSVVVCEPTNLEVCTGSRGRTYGNIFIKGHTGHGSQYGIANNAIFLAHQIVEEMLKRDFEKFRNKDYGKSFWQPLAINAGVEPCVVPDKCTMKIDARLVPGHMPTDIWKEMDEIIENIKKTFQGFNASIEVIDRREPWMTNKDANIIKNVKSSLKKCNLDFKETIFSGTTDGTILRRENRDVIIIGPGDLTCVHKENEKVLIPQVYEAFNLYRHMMVEN